MRNVVSIDDIDQKIELLELCGLVIAIVLVEIVVDGMVHPTFRYNAWIRRFVSIPGK